MPSMKYDWGRDVGKKWRRGIVKNEGEKHPYEQHSIFRRDVLEAKERLLRPIIDFETVANEISVEY